MDREGLQIWRVVANVLNKQLRRVEKGWSSSFGLGVKLINHSHKNACLLRNAIEGLEIARKIGMRFGTRNEYLQCRFTESSGKKISKEQAGFRQSKVSQTGQRWHRTSRE
jgi:hypothetical protein